MTKSILISLFFLVAGAVNAQVYNNEWIDYSKTYYKFKVGKTGLYRINQPLLPAGLATIPAEQFQLWRNGVEIPVYASVANGPLPSTGYIEFFGNKNDGIPDKALYKNQANQFSTALSLETDTASYFLTINTAGNSLRIKDDINNVSGNILPKEPYFLYNYRRDFQQMINRGYAVNYGEYVYASTYDMGEWWSTNDIHPDGPLVWDAGNLHVATGGPAAVFQIGYSGNSYLAKRGFPPTPRTVKVTLNGTDIYTNSNSLELDAVLASNITVPLSVFNSPTVNFSISEVFTDINDRFVVNFLDLKYPRLFDFDGLTNFEFSLAASAQGNYFEINNFDAGGSTPVLYDITNSKRYTANTAVAGLFRFALPSSAVERKLVLVSEDGTKINAVNGFTPRVFTNYSTAATQGDYLIITNKILWQAANNYAAYRNTLPGGAYNAKTYDIDELVDQFAFGIKKHPLSVKNFLRFARHNFSVPPQNAFLIGKAVSYDEYRINENSIYADQLNLVPTFGWPASDNLLSSEDLNPVPATPIGRLAAIRESEVQEYLDKVKEYELAQQNTIQTIDNKAWMKNMVHVVGASDQFLDNILTGDLNQYRNIIQDTFYGAHVTSFNKTTVTSTNAANALLAQLFNNGLSVLNYFGHSAATTLDYNLSSPVQFNNPGKYPLFIVNGCNAGNIYSFDISRIGLISSLSEKFVLAKGAGTIGFIASTHFGVESYLHSFNTGFYKSLAIPGYNKSVGINLQNAITNLLATNPGNSIAVLHAEESVLHGDPAIKINAHTKPDFVVEAPQVFINPTFISVADNSFDVKVYFYNIGKATGDSVAINIAHRYPDGSMATLVSKNIVSTRYLDSITLSVPIFASRDKGLNEICVRIDEDQRYDELSESNNSICKPFYIYEDELRPVYPYNFSIVNKSNIKLVASTANAIPTSLPRQYAMEIDTTELFNSPLKAMQTLSSVGGILEYNSTIPFTDSTVYYWRVAPVPISGSYRWNVSSFVYLPTSGYGYSQSHLYQHLKSTPDRIHMDSISRKWDFNTILTSFQINHAIFPTSGTQDANFQIKLNGQTITEYSCLGHSIIFNLFDPVTLKPFYNQAVPSTSPSGNYGGFLGSAFPCTKEGSNYNFEFSYLDILGRKKMNDFLSWVPNGLIVTARLMFDQPFDQNPYAPIWKNDPLVNGTNLYFNLKANGLADLDSFYYQRTWAFLFQKNVAAFTPIWKFSDGLYDAIQLNTNIASSDSLGYITSPAFGPANAWHTVKWRGASADTKPGDKINVDVIGISLAGTETVLYSLNQSQQDFDISSVNVGSFPYIKLKMRNADSVNITPYQLRYWRVLYDPVPEGALAPNIVYSFKDTLGLGEIMNAAIAFKNVSDIPFADSIKVNTTIYDASNVAHPVFIPRLKKLNPGDTAVINFQVDSKIYNGLNNIYLDVNPENDQPEQYHFNNFLYKNFNVITDNYKPILDITFDGVHILNNDIVSSQPHVLIKLKDESKFLLLNDTSLLTIQLVYPDGTQRRFYFNTDTLLFTAATSASADNTATVDFLPYLPEDGQYQLYVHGMDKTGNTAGNVDYTVTFTVYNKPMITNMLNYPNPFTTSTAFVFTVTGSVLPQNIRIQVLTITGKIVREIVQSELGPLHIGRNITEYKWDGTDQFGQKLANGVYIYRVLTNLNGKSLDKFPTYDANGNQVNTDKFFNKGYGKMYLMR